MQNSAEQKKIRGGRISVKGILEAIVIKAQYFICLLNKILLFNFILSWSRKILLLVQYPVKTGLGTCKVSFNAKAHTCTTFRLQLKLIN